jgi:hypothetical protein
MALLTDSQVREFRDLVQSALDAMDVEVATLAVIKRRLEAQIEMADLLVDRPA